MRYGFQDNMTQDMLDVLLTDEEIITEYELCEKKSKEAFKAADISLPSTAADGTPVLHGARNMTQMIADYWKERQRAISVYYDTLQRSRL